MYVIQGMGIVYVLSVVLCFIGATMRCISMYSSDLEERTLAKNGNYTYVPTLMIGEVVQYLILSFIPGVNTLWMLFDLYRQQINAGFNSLSNVMNIPLVPKDKSC